MDVCGGYPVTNKKGSRRFLEPLTGYLSLAVSDDDGLPLASHVDFVESGFLFIHTKTILFPPRFHVAMLRLIHFRLLQDPEVMKIFTKQVSATAAEATKV